MYDRIHEKLVAVKGHRIDMYLADFKVVSDTAADLLIPFQGKAPTVADVRDFVQTNFNNQLVPQTATMRILPDHRAVMLVAELSTGLRPTVDADRMTPITAGLYLDTATDEMWAVESSEDGKQHLKRRSNTNVAQLLKERQSRMPIKAGVLKIGDVVTANAQPIAGSIVSWYEAGRLEQGKVTNTMANSCRVLVGENSAKTISYKSIVQVTAELSKEDETKLTEYFTKAWGSKNYAQKFFKK